MPTSVLLDWVSTLSSIVLAIFTVALALVTWLYYRQSKRQTEEMQTTRQLKDEPNMKCGLKANGPNFEIGFVNTGRGIAHDVEAEYWAEGLEDYKRQWTVSVHFPDDIYRLGFPLDNSPIGVTGGSQQIFEKLDEGDENLVVKWKYKNSRGELFETEDRIPIEESLTTRIESTEFYSQGERETQF